MQSLYNLTGVFRGLAQFYILSLDKDIDGTRLGKDFVLNRWTVGPQGENIYFVSDIYPWLINRLIREIKPNAILLNGIFNANTTIPGLLIGRFRGIKTVLSPRGMLQGWALRRGKTKKSIFLFLLKLFLRKNERWHATTTQEKTEIQTFFGSKQKVFIASNVPRSVTEFSPVPYPDQHHKIKLVFLSLINSNKNLHMVINKLAAFRDKITLDIYGPVIDADYWIQCQRSIKGNNGVVYKGPVPPWEVPDILKSYHFFILPTQGENFGHAIFDALASGIPVIVSRLTPWQDLETKGAGFYINLEDTESMHRIFDSLTQIVETAYNRMRENSILYAREYWESKNYQKEYSFLLEMLKRNE